MKTIAIVGGSGYVGKKLIETLLQNNLFRIKVLTRINISFIADSNQVEFFKGDLLSPSSIAGFLEPGCIVVNLVYLWHSGENENLAVIENLIIACKSVKIDRLIHISTSAVTGRVDENIINEITVCNPISEYGITKYKIEKLFYTHSFNDFDLVILRPTSIYGPGSLPLRKLSVDLISGNRFINYFKSCIFGGRRMNLVHIENVIAAIIFVANRSENFFGEIFIVSEDDVSKNNFRDVEDILMDGFSLPKYFFPRLQLPLFILRVLLILLGRNNVNPYCNYSDIKLQGIGFRRPISFISGLTDYINSYQLNKGVSQNTSLDR